MNNTLTFEIAGRLVHLDEQAHARLNAYLNALRAALSGTDGAEEILDDIEGRLVELFDERLAASGREVVNEDDVAHAESKLGQPEDFMEEGEEQSRSRTARKLFRDREAGMIGGVVAGLAAYFAVEVTWIRLAFLALLVTGFAIPLYLILWILLPQAKTRADRLAMHGAEPTVENFKRRVSEELNGMSDRVKSTQFQSGVRRLFGHLERAVRVLFEVLGKVAGGLLVLIAVALLLGVVGLVSGLGGVSWGPMGFKVGGELLEFVRLTLPAGFGMAYAWTALALMMALPIALIVVAVRRLFFRQSGRLTWLLALGGVQTLAGAAMAAGIGARLGVEFTRDGLETHQINLPATTAVRAFRMQPVREDAAAWSGNDLSWMFDGEDVWLDDIRLDVHLADGDGARMRWQQEAHGVNRRAARARAGRMVFEPTADSTDVVLPDGFAFPREDRYRGQNISITLELPVGERVWFDPALEDWLDDVPNSLNAGGRNLVGKEWLMTAEGLVPAAEG